MKYNELMNALRSAQLYMEDLNGCDAEAEALDTTIEFMRYASYQVKRALGDVRETWVVRLVKEGEFRFFQDECATEEEAVEAARAAWAADEGPEAELWEPKVFSVTESYR